MRNLNKIILTITLFVTSIFAQNKDSKVSLQLDWLHQFQFAGYYIAKEKGFYKNKNLDVTIKEFNFNTNLLNNVLKNEASYAVGKSSLVIDKTSGSDIVALAAIYQHSPMVLITRKDSHIKTPKDLYKKKVMLTHDARMAVAINSMISSQGVKLGDVNFESHSFKIDDLINKKTDAMGSYLSNEPYILVKRNIAFNILNPKDYGFDFYGGILFTSNNELNNNPKRVKDFYDASLEGWNYAFSNIKETAQIILEKYNTQNKTLDALIYEGKILKDLAEFDEGKLGQISFKKYHEIEQIYSLLGYEHKDNVLNEFIYNPDNNSLTKQEKEYLKTRTFTYKLSKDKPFNINNTKGIEFEYLELLQSKIPIKIELIKDEDTKTKIDFNLSLKKINNGSLFSNKINSYAFAIVTQSNINYIQSLDNLEDKKFAIIKNSYFYNNFQKDYENFSYVVVDNIDKALSLLSKNEIYAVIDSIPAIIEKIANNRYDNLKISGITSLKHDIVYNVNNNKTLQTVLNKAIETISVNEIKRIDKKYLPIKKIIHKKNDNKLYILIAIIFIILSIILFFRKKLLNESQIRKNLEKDMKEISNTDELTGIYNRKMSIEMLKKSIEISKRYERPLCVIFFDIDNFKTINELYSHEIADQTLKELATLVSSNIRTTDVFGRWEGEEFILILPETSCEEATSSAQNLKNLIYNYDLII